MMGEPTIKVAETDLYRRGKKIKTDNELGYILDHSQPRWGRDFLVVTKGHEYYEWIDDKGNRTIENKTRFDDMLRIHRMEDGLI